MRYSRRTMLRSTPQTLELLAPAKSAAIGREAILHGADAVYIGGPSFGARHNASNDVGEIAGLVSFARRFHARVYVTLNTILHDAELEPARRLVRDCHDAGVDALIVQDMGLLELDLPPIDLHASTQCDIRTPAKARFLADAGFSQIVLARELTLREIAAVRAAVPADTVIEHFVHGALCVAFSGQCYISHAHTGRSANRGDCSQACRLPYTLQDGAGRVVAFDQHLLSMKDNNQSANLRALIDAGVTSFKIEGRYKEAAYVKNITGHYRPVAGRDSRRAAGACARLERTGATAVHARPRQDVPPRRPPIISHTAGRRTSARSTRRPSSAPRWARSRRIGTDAFDLRTNLTPANGDGLALFLTGATLSACGSTARNAWATPTVNPSGACGRTSTSTRCRA